MGQDPKVKYLLSLTAVRQRAKVVGDAAQAGQLNHFDLDETRMDEVADFVTSVIKRDFGPDRFDTIPPHGRWQHFEAGKVPRIADMIDGWRREACDDMEIARRLVDLFFVSVLLDAGAGDGWRWIEPGTGRTYERSEGIAVASLYMFQKLDFTVKKDGKTPLVDGKALEQLPVDVLVEGFQTSETNPMLGVGSRTDLLRRLGKSLLGQSDVFGEEGRPGNIVDYMTKSTADPARLDILVFWDVLQALLIPIWPHDRTTVHGQPIGDAWPLRVLQKHLRNASTKLDDVDVDIDDESNAEDIQPFHKLTQWLTYSLMVPFQRILGVQWTNAESLTALAEYRNGGLFVDLGALSLKKEALDRGLKASGGPLPLFEAGDDVIIEWRAMTLVLIDKLYSMVLSRMDRVHLTLAQLLEAGTWKSGREIAARRRPDTKSSPILIESDGTVF
ncbi:hypothetical protein A1O3_02072 [Capronia epimyces CBS 606.96]|uniref:Uracil catabolism protein 4 n=1 Tax=Capronia epimyces CBS 606.96 TaxID=1182542 RepID=W9Y901_9EURO|nr:uncharacterized protein A1O3_02072 [Capronia epimyces CBS 606.96]EXJ89008.1 hypothetical protein A1O3_02072 [Capronia epimyces CBS 606.96]